jgi:hypothetical protein
MLFPCSHISARAVGWVYNRTARSAAIYNYPPQGRIVSLDTHDMHIDCRGEAGGRDGGELVSPTGTGRWKIPLELWFAVDGTRRAA